MFAQAGANLILTARREAQLTEVAEAAKAANKAGGTGKGGEVATIILDMQDRKAVADVLSKVPDSLKRIDILVNNAGKHSRSLKLSGFPVGGSLVGWAARCVGEWGPGQDCEDSLASVRRAGFNSAEISATTHIPLTNASPADGESLLLPDTFTYPCRSLTTLAPAQNFFFFFSVGALIVLFLPRVVRRPSGPLAIANPVA